MNDATLIPRAVNQGPFLTAYTHARLMSATRGQTLVLPICSLATPVEQLASLGEFVLPPLYHEGLDDNLKAGICARVERCFPFYESSRARAERTDVSLQIVELPPQQLPSVDSPEIYAFSVDTAVEEHGPHLPLATDTIQSYGVLEAIAVEFPGLKVGRPVEYGQLTWGLPFGFSIDITAPLLTTYVSNLVNALLEWQSPKAFYVVDVHGSIVHRTAIEDGIRASNCERYGFRWLHEPLVEFAGQRGDQHAGGVETALVEYFSPDLLDSEWWPHRLDELAAGQLDMHEAIRLSDDLDTFCREAERRTLNGIVGDIRNYSAVDAQTMMDMMLDTVRGDLRKLSGDQ